MVFGMKKKRNCVQIPFLLKVKNHGFWYEKEKELCPNQLYIMVFGRPLFPAKTSRNHQMSLLVMSCPVVQFPATIPPAFNIKAAPHLDLSQSLD